MCSHQLRSSVTILRALRESEVLQIPLPLPWVMLGESSHAQFAGRLPRITGAGQACNLSHLSASVLAAHSAEASENRLNGHFGQETTVSAAAAASSLMKDNETKGTESGTSQHALGPAC